MVAAGQEEVLAMEEFQKRGKLYLLPSGGVVAMTWQAASRARAHMESELAEAGVDSGYGGAGV